MSQEPSATSGAKATVKRWLGWATADRQVEAEGRAEEQVSEPTDAAVDREREQIRSEAGETPEGAPGADSPR